MRRLLAGASDPTSASWSLFLALLRPNRLTRRRDRSLELTNMFLDVIGRLGSFERPVRDKSWLPLRKCPTESARASVFFPLVSLPGLWHNSRMALSADSGVVSWFPKHGFQPCLLRHLCRELFNRYGVKRKATVVHLRNVVNEMEVFDDDYHAFLNRVTGELYTITHDEIRAIEEEDDLEEHPAWQQERIRKAGEIFDSEDWLQLPSKFDIHEWEIMKDFCYSVDDDRLRSELLDAIHGSGAFRHFKNTVHYRGIQQDWYRFRQLAWITSPGSGWRRTRFRTLRRSSATLAT